MHVYTLLDVCGHDTQQGPGIMYGVIALRFHKCVLTLNKVDCVYV